MTDVPTDCGRGMLRYTALPAPEEVPFRLPREVPELGRRLLSRGRLSGALHTLGYYSTDVCLGTPPHRYDLIVDTGSSITAVPCSTCRQCGDHVCGPAGRFDLSRSSTSRGVTCSGARSVPWLRCGRCSGDEPCPYSVHYTEGSEIRGTVVSDIAHFQRAAEGSPAANVSARVYFGCQHTETGMFQRQRADGIMGVQASRNRGRVPSMLSSLVEQYRAPHAFSLCLSDAHGLFLMGGAPSAARLRKANALSLPMEKGSRALFTLALAHIRISRTGRANGSTADYVQLGGFSQASLRPAIVDSGTTFVYASTPVHRSLVGAIRKQLPREGPRPKFARHESKICALLSDAELDALPRLQLVFTAAPTRPLTVTPRQYMVQFPPPRNAHGAAGAASMRAAPAGARHYCVGIFDNRNGGTVIGASILRHREILFELDASRIAFVDADCATATPATSYLEHPFSFAPCDGTPKAAKRPTRARPPRPLPLHQRPSTRAPARANVSANATAAARRAHRALPSAFRGEAPPRQRAAKAGGNGGPSRPSRSQDDGLFSAGLSTALSRIPGIGKLLGS